VRSPDATVRRVVSRVAARLGSSPFVRRDLRAALAPWAISHGIVLVGLWLSRFVADRLPVSAMKTAPAAGLFIYDGGWYRAIAEQGYSQLVHGSLRFFPLYPLLGRWLGYVFVDHIALALVCIGAVASLLLGACIHRLMLSETGDAALAQRSAWFVAVFPAALSLGLAYAEPLFMLAAVAMFLCLRSRRWLLAVPLGLAAGLSRPVGLLLVVPAVVEAIRGWDRAPIRDRLSRAAAVLSPAVGTGIYLGWVGAVFGNPLTPFNVQARDDLRGASTDPITHIVDSIGDVFDGDRFGAGLHLLWLVGFAVVVVVLARRLPASYAAYVGVSLALGITASNISSFERYVWSSFPVAIGVALLTTRAEVRRGVNALAAAGLLAYAILAFFGVYTP
jgi:hypothetical protein